MIEIKGYDGRYLIDESGNVLSKKRNKNGKLLKPQINTNGYKFVTLCDDKEREQICIHRLIALHFIENPLNLPDINHIDGDTLNNKIENLEWCTTKHNMEHAVKIGRIKTKQVVQKDPAGIVVKVFNSLGDVGRSGFQKSNVSACCNGRKDLAHGFSWVYA